MIHYLIIPLLLLISFSCKEEDNKPYPLSEDSEAYINGKIYTVDSNNPWAEAMIIKNGVIFKIGTTEEIENIASDSIKINDLAGNMVMPGIHDVHLHPLEAASENFLFVLDTEETDPENYYTDINKAVKANSDATWILGWGFDIYALFEAEREPIEILDEISTDKPIAIMEQTSHSVWVNSKALELAGLDENSENPTGGIIMKGENGKPNGILIDNAGNLIVQLAISSIPNTFDKDYEGLVNYALPELAKNGITSVCDARTYWKANHHEVWKKVETDNKLTVRANLGLWLYPTEDDNTQIENIRSLYSNDSESLLKINQIKLYSDGIIVNTTSAMFDDYKFDLFNLPTNDGLNYVTQERIEKYISALEPTGFDFHIHAIGNRGIHESLNAIENASSNTGRHRITHVEYVSPQDYSRFNALNVTADAQVAGDFTNPEHWHDNDDFIDASLNESIVPIKSLSEANARITLSSDWDVSALNPFIGMQNSVTRSPQNITLEKSIEAYTINAAYVMRQENKVGSLVEGKEADFIVLNQNIFEVDPSLISKTKVLKTYLKGQLVFQ